MPRKPDGCELREEEEEWFRAEIGTRVDLCEFIFLFLASFVRVGVASIAFLSVRFLVPIYHAHLVFMCFPTGRLFLVLHPKDYGESSLLGAPGNLMDPYIRTHRSCFDGHHYYTRPTKGTYPAPMIPLIQRVGQWSKCVTNFNFNPMRYSSKGDHMRCTLAAVPLPSLPASGHTERIPS